MADVFSKVLEPFSALPTSKKWTLGAIVVATLLGFALLVSLVNQVDYKPLFTNLSNEDAGDIVKKLQEQKIPYQISGDGKAILVPGEKVYDVRLSMATEGLPQGGGVGFEIFDKKSFGMTEFTQKLNHQRALQGELQRTIQQLAGIEQARVHLALPAESLFKDKEKTPTASVVLKLKSQKQLKPGDVQGIIHLVSSSVEGMTPENVTIIDSKGKMIAKGESSDPASKMTSNMIETQRGLEKDVEERLQSLLDKVVGNGRSVARVTASMDFRKVEKFEEKYDPESLALRSEQRSEERDAAASGAQGVPGVASNMGNAAAGQGGAGSSSGKSDETMNYEVSRLTAKTVEPIGALTKISVAILIDGKYTPGAPGKDGVPAKSKYAPRTQEELQKIETLVKTSVGFSQQRGDQVSVVNIPFEEGADDAGAGQDPKILELIGSPAVLSLGKNIFIAALFMFLVMFVIRPTLKNLTTNQDTSKKVLELQRENREQLEQFKAKAQTQAMRSASQQELAETVKKDPNSTAQIISTWIKNQDY